jgi:hypothetical protein
MYRRVPLLGLLITLMLMGCSMRVSPDRVYGTYVASYPFGTDTLTLNQDLSFVQRVDIRGGESATVRGKWDFDPGESQVTLYGAMIAADEFDHLRKEWKTVTSGIVSLDVEIRWFKILIGSAFTYPYVKQ